MTTAPGESVEEKRALRERLRARRADIPRGERREAAQRLAKGLARHPLVVRLEPSTVLVPATHGDEIETEPVARVLEDQGWQIHRPRSVRATTGIDVVPWATHAPLVPGAHGVPEPPSEAETVPPDRLRLILVPGLGFALDGARLGTGLGYFDRFLAPLTRATAPPVLIGLGYRFQLAPRIPVASHDVRMHGLQLEERAVQCGQRAGQG